MAVGPLSYCHDRVLKMETSTDTRMHEISTVKQPVSLQQLWMLPLKLDWFYMQRLAGVLTWGRIFFFLLFAAFGPENSFSSAAKAALAFATFLFGPAPLNFCPSTSTWNGDMNLYPACLLLGKASCSQLKPEAICKEFKQQGNSLLQIKHKLAFPSGSTRHYMVESTTSSSAQ